MSVSMRCGLIDSHSHVQFAAYDPDRPAVIQRSFDAGVGIINVGTTFITSREGIKLAEEYTEGLWATAGFHPSHAASSAHHDPWELRSAVQESFDYEKFLALAGHPKVVAIGECGLDYFRLNDSASAIKQQQKEIFIAHIRLANELQKPLVVHCRPQANDDAYGDLLGILRTHPVRAPAVLHFFVGKKDTAQKFLDLGCFLSFSGVITFAQEYEEVVRFVPLERLLVETDAPYAAPAPYRGKRNEPAYVIEVVKKVAEIRGLAFEEVAVVTTANAKQVFRI